MKIPSWLRKLVPFWDRLDCSSGFLGCESSALDAFQQQWCKCLIDEASNDVSNQVGHHAECQQTEYIPQEHHHPARRRVLRK